MTWNSESNSAKAVICCATFQQCYLPAKSYSFIKLSMIIDIIDSVDWYLMTNIRLGKCGDIGKNQDA